MLKVSKSRIIELYKQGLGVVEISQKLRCAKSTISYHCNKIGLYTKDKRFSEEKVKDYQLLYDNGKSLKEIGELYNISRQALSKRIKNKRLKISQKTNSGKRSTKSYRKRTKEKCVKYKGGKCERCGYNKCIQALDFHHINPKEKDFTISGGTKSFESLKSELDKCILVCKNCHSEIHADIYPLTDTE